MKSLATNCLKMVRRSMAVLLCLLFPIISFAEEHPGSGPTSVIGPVNTVTAKFSTGEDKGTVQVWKNRYDPQGRLIESEESYNSMGEAHNTTGQRTIFSYDAQGTKKEETSYDLEGNLLIKRIYTHDGEGNVEKEISFAADGSLKEKMVSTPDNNAKRREIIFYDSNNSVISSLVNIYDDKGHIKESTFYKPKDTIDYRSISKYDEEGNEIQTVVYNADGSLDTKRVYAYDPRGHVKEVTISTGDGSVREKESYGYEFDRMGNWIKKTTQKWIRKGEKLSPELPYTIERTITYY